ncbi:MAG: methyltransferase, partial [Glaciecola sp.]
QNTVIDDIAWQMFLDAKRVLRPGGELRIVGNRHLDHRVKLSKLFGGCKVVASDKKFVVLKAIKHD